ncbi:MAG TPA: hypothetical protein CFH81_06805 [Sulfurovum sp. UBA12169]|nr:MAG TPA: hypothetical protein CFH81_06805 [Sulfurovum sp. UBA12169]
MELAKKGIMHSSKLFDPAVRLIGNIKYTRKIALASFIFFLPVLLLLFLGYNYLGNQYLAIQKFQSRLHYNQKVQGFFEYILLERGMMAALGHGDNTYKRHIQANFSKIESAMAAVDALSAPTPHIKQEWEKIKTEWALLRQELWNLSPQQNFDRHTDLADQVLHLTQDTDVDPELINNTDLSITHLAEILNEHLPALAQEAGKARAIGTAVIMKQSMSLEEKRAATLLYGTAQSHKAGIEHAFEITCKSQHDICRAISPFIEKIKHKTDRFGDRFVFEIINTDHWSLDAKNYFDEATQIISHYFDTYDAVFDALQKHLSSQLSLLAKQIIAISIIAAVMLICLIYFMMGFYFSFIKSLKSLTKASQMIALGNFGISVPIQTRDEMADVSYAFNEMGQKIKQTFAFLESYKKAIDESNIVSITDIDGNITYANDQFCKITGYTREELIGQNHRILKDPATPDKIYEELWKTILDKRVWSGILKNIDKNKKPFYVDATITPIINAEGEIVEFAATRHNITQLIEQKEKLAHQLYTDFLTELPNRLKLLEDLKYTHRSSILALINIDRFSEINEFYGTDTGDEVLIQMRDRITSFLEGASFKLYHIYADEFALLIEKHDLQNYDKNLLEMLHKHIELHPFLIQGNAIIVGITLGAIDHTDTKHYLLTDTDMVLRHAKKSQKNILILSEVDTIKEEIAHNIEYIGKIKEAMTANRIIPYFQPIVNTASGTITKHECLMRLITSEGVVVSPSSFLVVAKKAHLYTNLTRIIIEKVFAVFENREDEFSINLSVDDIMDSATVEFIMDKIENPKFNRRVIFEITESEEFENFEEVRRFISEAKRRGAKIAIDDFGSGYSNFAYLIHLQVDFIKIDASLIKNIDKDSSSRIIVETIVTFAKLLGIKTIAEFVHSREVFEVVQKIGVDFSQGFYFYEPQSKPSQTDPL